MDKRIKIKIRKFREVEILIPVENHIQLKGWGQTNKFREAKKDFNIF